MALLGGQQPGQVAKKFRGDVERGTIGITVHFRRAHLSVPTDTSLMAGTAKRADSAGTP
jgi:hypothetical protein